MNQLLDKVNSDIVTTFDQDMVPVLATPAAFLAGVVAGGKACGVLVAAAGVGAAIGKAVTR